MKVSTTGNTKGNSWQLRVVFPNSRTSWSHLRITWIHEKAGDNHCQRKKWNSVSIFFRRWSFVCGQVCCVQEPTSQETGVRLPRLQSMNVRESVLRTLYSPNAGMIIFSPFWSFNKKDFIGYKIGVFKSTWNRFNRLFPFRNTNPSSSESWGSRFWVENPAVILELVKMRWKNNLKRTVINEKPLVLIT